MAGVSKAKRAEVAQRRADAIRLRIAGLEWQEIADRLHYASKGAACTDVTRALQERAADRDQAVDEMRTLETMRLDRIMAGLWPKAASGNARAADTVVRIIDRRCKLNGLDVRGIAEQDPTQALSIVGQLMAAIAGAAELPDMSTPDPGEPDGALPDPA